ncbi:GAF domain-containing protein [Methylobacterium brachythecii]|uniref:GAF domain-containing protein n=1 Tax=Methylobacterium brachythecii TaxID=1176177 RepID=A0A7W6AND2_9HYPH|nr:GAF domain-containing protein [Methylobacterium brachythecii]MBB3902822.1 hypothetical protein [Methylobacterium brachythecii]GLS43747.1 GAF domain-containing protein [Methylobacterium brachythecii]
MQPFIRVAEIWLPDEVGETLCLGAGLYGNQDAFAAYSRPMRFARGEGLPGKAWADRHPVIMGSFTGTTFRRTAAAAEAGLTSGIAMPIFEHETIKAVVVFLCGAPENYVGAVEVWVNDPERDAQIGLHDGHYGGAELFERTSRMTRFGRSFGLPGTVWATGMPAVLPELFRADRFLRREEAIKVGLTSGVGLPFDFDPPRTWVMTFLSAQGTPIVGRFEVWVPDEQGLALVYLGGLDTGENGERPARVAAGDGLLGRVLSTGLPSASEDCRQDAPWLISTDGDTTGQALAMPLLSADGRIMAVTLWRL